VPAKPKPSKITDEARRAFAGELSALLKSRRGAAWDFAARDHYRALLNRYEVTEKLLPTMPADGTPLGQI
jgi:hypothetical protein